MNSIRSKFIEHIHGYYQRLEYLLKLRLKYIQGVSNSKQEAAAREKERELDKEQKSRRDSRRNSVLPKDLDINWIVGKLEII